MRTLVAIALMSLFMTSMAQNNLPTDPHIYVEGTARIDTEPSIFRVEAMLSATDMDMAKAEQELAAKLKRFVQACEAAGVDRESIRTSLLMVEPYHVWEDGVHHFRGYQLSHDLSVRLSPIDEHAQLLTSILASNTVNSLDSGFDVENADGLLEQAQLDAMDDAHQRAEKLAARAGKRLGSVYSVSEFDFRSWETSDLIPQRSITQGTTDISVGELDRVMVTGSRLWQDPPVGLKPDRMAAEAKVYVVYLLRN